MQDENEEAKDKENEIVEEEDDDEDEKFESTEDILSGEGEQLLSNMEKAENQIFETEKTEETFETEDTGETEEQETESVRRLL